MEIIQFQLKEIWNTNIYISNYVHFNIVMKTL
jgi:hypothetical protein